MGVWQQVRFKYTQQKLAVKKLNQVSKTQRVALPPDQKNQDTIQSKQNGAL